MYRINYRLLSERIAEQEKKQYDPMYLRKVHLGKLYSSIATKLIKKHIRDHTSKRTVWVLDYRVISNSVFAEFGKFYEPYYLKAVHTGQYPSVKIKEFIEHMVSD